ncbi:PhzF family phenazine biosynthesis protein [Microtetraspora sp. AC03309]|uniref:PhzF family phenazine biosynthesis protein n=1 Tax=Microtetraspora sp. AC03309 TaxID=2779376 RepID=UPI001E447F5F|nr:PhzF family phenazine biosynthesis protein [Microtetraspora sp. AC03309]MCC5577361.1 PhzF family phenazine biosynthesis protein [Microtetraspora sp. AC03309]
MRIFTVDSFTDQPFKGNPAAVCLLEASAADSWMQSVAAEMRHSETAFVLGPDASGRYSLRWFTPSVEVALCGHATLAAAHVLYSTGRAEGKIEFATKSGILAVSQSEDGSIVMDFPAHSPSEITPPSGLAEALGVPVRWTGMGGFDLLAEVESEQAVRDLTPDIDALTAFDVRAVIVTAPAASTHTPTAGTASVPTGGPEHVSPVGLSSEGAELTTFGEPDYVSRFFAPRVGVPEDPVTGSAHCVLAPYWSAKLGRDTLVGAQLSARSGVMRTTIKGERVELVGQAVTIWSGELHA